MSPTSIIIVCLLLAAVINFSVSKPIAKRATGQTITYDQFLGLQLNWSRQQITQYLNNEPGQVISESQSETTLTQVIYYTNTNPFGIVVLILTNNQLISKAQTGVNQNNYPISRAQFDQITTGMTRAQVTSLVGNEGELLISITGPIENVRYTGDSNSYGIAKITFSRGIVTSKIAVGL